MSYDIYIQAKPCKECGNEISVDVGNATYNYGPAHHEAMGFTLSALDGVSAAVPIKALEHCLEEFKKHPDRYHDLIRGGGTWGTIHTMSEYTHKLLDACRAMPTGIIKVS